MNSVQVIEKNAGPKIAWEQDGYRLYLGDDEIMINASKYQRDWNVHIDICSNRDGQLVIGTGEGLFYVAQIDIPAIRYTEPEEPETDDKGEGMNNAAPPEPIPLDMGEVVLTLWSLQRQPENINAGEEQNDV